MIASFAVDFHSFLSQRGTREAMENSSAITDHKNTIQLVSCTAHSSEKHWAFVSAIYLFLSITAILGNTLILVALHKESSLHPPSKLLYRCLATTDLLVGLILEPSVAAYFVLVGTEKSSSNSCFYFATINVVGFTTLSAVSLLTMTTISVDRLLALLLGLRYRQLVTLRRGRALITSFWIVSLGFAVMTIWEFSIGKSYNYTLILLCISVSLFCYLKILFTLRQNQIQAQQPQGLPIGGGIPFNIARYRKTVNTAIWVEVTLIACYLPYSIVIAIITIHGSSPFLDAMRGTTGALVSLNSTLNPILYCWKIKAVKQEVKNTIGQFLCLSN